MQCDLGASAPLQPHPAVHTPVEARQALSMERVPVEVFGRLMSVAGVVAGVCVVIS